MVHLLAPRLTEHAWSRERYNDRMNDPKIVISVVLVAVLLLVGLMARATVRRMDLSPEQRRRTKNMILYGIFVIIAAGLTITWAEQLAEAAIVASGFAVALVLFHKELVLNVLGWWIKTMGSSFRIGDRIRVGTMRGDVIDYGVLTTTLMEVEHTAEHGMRTGNVICIPNAHLLTEPVVNETRILNFEWKEVAFDLNAAEDWRAAEAMVMREAQSLVAEYRAEVERELSQMSETFAFHAIRVDPFVFVKSAPDGGVRLWVRLAVPSRRIFEIADRLNRAMIEWRQSATEV